MNDIEKHALRRWLVVQLVTVYRVRDKTFYPDDEFDHTFSHGREAAYISVGHRIFGHADTLLMVEEAKKEATY